MNTPTLDPILSKAIEDELAALGTAESRLQRHQRRERGVAAAAAGFAVVALITGGAIVIGSFPGETTTSPLGTVVTGSFEGTAVIDLGEVPTGAGAVILDITCTAGGTIEVATVQENQSATWDCSNPTRENTTHIVDGRLPEAGSTSITITADPGTVWSVTAQYASRVATEWKTNANGQTYGVPNDDGTPDLVPAQATNGRIGYIVPGDTLSLGFGVDGTINVYESDGTTVIGQFPIGDN
jgi:hypothetical protein